MKLSLNIQKIKVIIYGAMLIIFGLLFCFIPEKSLNVVEIVVASIFLAYGILLLFGFCFSPAELKEPVMLAESLIYIVVGLLLDFFPFLFICGVGCIITLFGCRHLVSSINYKFHSDKNWWADLTISLVIVILGLLCIILSRTHVAASAVSIVFGISLIINGASCFVFLFALKRFNKKLKKVTTIEYAKEKND